LDASAAAVDCGWEGEGIDEGDVDSVSVSRSTSGVQKSEQVKWTWAGP